MKRSFFIYLIFCFALTTSFAFAQVIKCDSQKLIPLKYRQSGPAVKNLQACLIKLGFNIPSGATGYYGNQTLNAVKEFYRTWYGDWQGYNIGPLGIKKLKEFLSLMVTERNVEVKKFASENEFKNYLTLANKEKEYMQQTFVGRGIIESAPLMLQSAPSAKTPERISETTVQVKSIDEPDIVKTDGTNIYFAQSQIFRILPMTESIIRCVPGTRDCPESMETPKTKIIKAFPVEELKLATSIDKTGDLLLLRNRKVLVIFSGNKIYGYDVSDPQNPKEKWDISLENSWLIGARLYNDKIYLAFRSWVNTLDPCPIKPLFINKKEISFNCNEIYHPNIIIPVDILFNIIVINPENGELENKVSFIGSERDSVLYMSPNNIYLTYSHNENLAKHLIDFFTQQKDLLTESILRRLEKLKEYDISDGAKIFELENILNNYKKSLKEDERLKFENELQNRISKYYQLNKRNIEKTNIVKVNLERFDVSAIGQVPGYPLNQFSLDEYRDNLRIAVTVGGRGLGFGLWWLGGREQSINDVYILDKNLKVLSSVQDLGKGERIYSVRFIEDKGYVVTFRETDPFYVLDLREAQNPKLKGELKIPGYSSYLHPISKDKLLGIGMEDVNVKISLFDVSNPENPVEKDKYILKEGWSEVLHNFHAFLLDDKHQIFFIPASEGGYIFSYKNDKLSLVKTIGGFNVKRAIYLDDYLYVISENKITVINEINWETLKELSF